MNAMMPVSVLQGMATDNLAGGRPAAGALRLLLDRGPQLCVDGIGGRGEVGAH